VPMELDFYKVHACRNDLILLNYLYKDQFPDRRLLPLLARRMCDRHSGVGANGLLVLERGSEHPVRLTHLLPTGEVTDRQNDALLCLARIAFDSGVSGGKRVVVESRVGVRTVDFIDSAHFRVSIGRPSAVDGSVELREEPNREYTTPVKIDGKRYSVTPLHLQYPSAVLFSTDWSRAKLMHLSRSLRQPAVYSHGVHPVFCQVYSKDEMAIRTWFRREPVDYSSAAGIAVVAAVLNGLADREVLVHCNNDELFVQWQEATNEVYVTGSVDYLFTGTYYFEEERQTEEAPPL